MSETARFDPAAPLRGRYEAPPDKSISHRAAILAAMSEGTCHINGYLDAGDTRSTLSAVQALGASVKLGLPGPRGEIEVKIGGIGLYGPSRRREPVSIDVGNAGTLLRILPGWLAGQRSGSFSLDGDESIKARPVDRIAIPLRKMGARVSIRDGRLTPLVVEGSPLDGVDHTLPIASAQVKSCLILAALLARRSTTIVEPGPSRDHTERMWRAAGAEIRVDKLASMPGRSHDPRRLVVQPASRLRCPRIDVSSDFSSAAFFIVAALLVPGSELRIRRVNLNSTRIGLLAILNRMGARIEVMEDPLARGEPVGDLIVRASALTGTLVGAVEVAAAIDELPLLALLGAFAAGETVLCGAKDLRNKESDRIAAAVRVIGGLGGAIEEREDGFVVQGGDGLDGGAISAGGDHRIAMLGAIAGVASRRGVEVEGIDTAAISYPNFCDDLARLNA